MQLFKLYGIKNFAANIREQESQLPFLLNAISFGGGCLLYFANYSASLLLWFLPALLLCVYFNLLRTICIAAIFIGAGFTLAKYQTQNIDTEMLQNQMQAVVVGRVQEIEKRTNGRTRYTLKITSGDIKNESAKNLTTQVRLTAKNANNKIKIGDSIIGFANLQPPTGAAYPNGYSPYFNHWLQGIGAWGYYTSPPQIVKSGKKNNFTEYINSLRFTIAEKIRQTIPNQAGALAVAMIVGDRSGINETTSNYLRQAGLAHILAISGLHMGLVALILMYATRFLLARFNNILMSYDIKKFASIFALLITTIYLFLSGLPISAQRAYIMIAIMLLAIIFNRRAISMRNVAFAFILILIISPYAILSVSFQLSFAAVVGLVAMYEFINGMMQKNEWHEKFSNMNFIKKFLLKDIAAIATTALVASMSTLLFSAYHFHYIVPFSVLANMLAMPIVSLALMPAAIISIFLMLFNLHALPLYFTAFAIEIVVFIAKLVASFELTFDVGYVSNVVLLICVCGFLILCLLKSVVRVAGIFILAAGIFLQANIELPKILISQDGNQVGIIENEKLYLLNPREDKFTADIWRRAFAPASPNLTSDIFNCNKNNCRAEVEGKKILIVKNGEANCQNVNIVISLNNSRCETFSGITITRDSLAKQGATAIYLDSARVDTAN